MASTAQLPAHEQEAIAIYFDGDAEFYRIFLASAVQQFPADLREGDAAVQAGDVQALRRAAHTLKGVLLTLGHADLSAFAKTVEQAAQQSPWDEAVAGWRELSARLIAAFSLA
ncbi:MAG: Hpt domain-containing protein [Burkholderiales bacterium]|nr:Hpt domain-containing protein [Burkholderiales bacterium]